jgi:hypothetical protein
MAGPVTTPIAGNTSFSFVSVFRSSAATKFPRGTLSYSTATTNRVLATSATSDVSVTWTAELNRVYLLTYFEPFVEHTTASGPVNTDMTIRVDNTAGAQVALTRHACIGNDSRILCMAILTSLTGSVTYAGCLLTASTTGTPTAFRAVTYPAYMTVEDIGGN